MGSECIRLGALVGVVVSICGCAASTKQRPVARTAADTVPEDAFVADVLRHHRHHHFGGTLLLITMSLDTLGLPADEQLRIEKIQSDLIDKMRPASQAERSVVARLADGVSASEIDRTQVDAALAELATASAAMHDASIAELNRLHAALTPPERAALVDKLDAHWELWKQANSGERSQLATIGQEIGLTAPQMEKVRRELAATTSDSPLRKGEVEAHLRNFGKAFQANDFDARRLLGAASANRQMAEWGASRLVSFCQAVNPVLNDEQRRTLVALLLEHLNHDEGGAKE